ncbi:MAG: endonuclease/exonuclease/phosphatase family protein [Allosphingosinicella sp.]|uniref:endonuclease/exonuclease/phosphatase family protein n=1 Tax=Allosphingosinicella sp. TaxID=2823234 RepID=UPI0039298E88
MKTGRGRIGRGMAALGAALLLAGCAGMPGPRAERCVASDAMPDIVVDPATGEHMTTLSVLIYNVEGLPWPARSNRGYRLDEIARQLAQLRAEGRAPQVVLLQEAFTRRAARIPVEAGYPNYVRGPTRSERLSRAEMAEEAPRLPGRRSFRRGERFGTFLSSGLAAASDFPILAHWTEPFHRRECAGYDCLANKGVMMVRVWLPGVPAPVDIFNTHLNSRRSTGVPEERSLAAHRLQTDRGAEFIDRYRDPANPLIFGGDFNMAEAPDRMVHFFDRKPWPIVHHWCLVVARDCQIKMSWDGDEPWMDTQDLQGFDQGERVRIRPIRIEAMFDEPWRGAPLADHDGLLVTYRLSWSADAAPPPSRCRPEGL